MGLKVGQLNLKNPDNNFALFLSFCIYIICKFYM